MCAALVAGTVMVMTTVDLHANNAALSGGVGGGELQRTQESLKIALLTIDKLKVELAYLRRMKYGRSSEQLDELVERAQRVIRGVEPQQLRDSQSLRQQVSAQGLLQISFGTSSGTSGTTTNLIQITATLTRIYRM